MCLREDAYSNIPQLFISSSLPLVFTDHKHSQYVYGITLDVTEQLSQLYENLFVFLNIFCLLVT